MADNENALVLHMAGVPEPMWIAIDAPAVDELDKALPRKLIQGEIEQIHAADGTTVNVNFHHVVTAHMDVAPPLGRIYGSKKRRRND